MRQPKLLEGFDRFLNTAGSLQAVAFFRIGYSILLLISLSFWWLDATRIFSDEGLLSSQTAQGLVYGYQLSLFDLVPASPTLVQGAIVVCLIQTVCLMLGVYSRFQAVCIFLWLATLQHRNPIVCDGEDTLFRLFAFFLIFMPLDGAWSVLKGWGNKNLKHLPSTWALRLVQLQMSIVYASTAWAKWQGVTWRDGSATYLVLQMPDLYGRGWVPESFSETEWILRAATWSVLLVEALLPFGLWFAKTRHLAVAVALLMHLSIEYTMHLFLFEWIMILGLMTFVDWGKLKRLTRSTIFNGSSGEQQLELSSS